ncbi:hypothetical protein AB6A40_011451, partial [Gnathostoma spinigerum]
STFKTHRQRFELSYGTGWCVGTYGEDRLEISPGAVVEKQTFGVADRIAKIFRVQPADGILGLAFPSIAADHVTPPFYNLLPQLDEQIFTFYMERWV